MSTATATTTKLVCYRCGRRLKRDRYVTTNTPQSGLPKRRRYCWPGEGCNKTGAKVSARAKARREGTMSEDVITEAAPQPTAEELDAQIAALQVTMDANHDGWKAYNHAHAALREAQEKRTTQAPHKEAKEANRDQQKLYWNAYTKARKLKKQRVELYGEPAEETA